MTYQIVILDSFYKEVEKEQDYYDELVSGLGSKLGLEVGAAILLIQKTPLLFQKKRKSLRMYKLKKFPYYLIYELSKNTIYIYSFYHVKRNQRKKF
jgi:mRNA-degrading endonuclease RelE of RelBE toxin-antitoxin system